MDKLQDKVQSIYLKFKGAHYMYSFGYRSSLITEILHPYISKLKSQVACGWYDTTIKVGDGESSQANDSQSLDKVANYFGQDDFDNYLYNSDYVPAELCIDLIHNTILDIMGSDEYRAPGNSTPEHIEELDNYIYDLDDKADRILRSQVPLYKIAGSGNQGSISYKDLSNAQPTTIEDVSTIINDLAKNK